MDISREIEIAYQIDDSCVKVAVETLRKALGYRKPSRIHHGKLTNGQIVSTIADWFLRHEIYAYISDSTKQDFPKNKRNIIYAGTHVEFDKRPCLWMFAYESQGENIGHMVVGYPVAYGDMILSCAYKIMI